MKIKKLLCTVLAASLMVPTTGIVNPDSAIVNAASRPVLTGVINENPVYVNDTDYISINVEESGIYTLSAKSRGANVNYKILREDEFSSFGEIFNEAGNEKAKSENFYFEANRLYFMIYNRGDLFDNMVKINGNYEAEISLKKSKLTLDSNEGIHPTVSAKVLGNNGAEEVEDINSIDGVKWTEETNTLEFKNYNGNHAFNIEYTPAFFYNSEDFKNMNVNFNDELVINVKGKNTFAGMNIRGAETAINVKNIATRFTGDGIINFNNGINPEAEVEEDAEPVASEEYAVFNSNSNVTFDGPSLEIEELGKFIPISAEVINMNNGYIVVDLLSYTSLDEIGKSDIGSANLNLPLFYADVINLNDGTIYMNFDGGPGELYHFWSLGCFYATYKITLSKDINIMINGDLEKFELESHSGSKENVIYLFVIEEINVFDGEVKFDENLFIYRDLDKVIIPEPSDPDKEEENNNNQENNNQENNNQESGQVVNNDQSANADNKQTTDKKKDDEKAEEVAAVGSKLSDKNFKYVVTKAGTKDGKTVGEVELTGVKNVKAKNLTIKGTVKIDGVKYKVTSIGKKAFAKAKKLKKINIKSKFIKKIAKGAFKKTNKKLVVKVPKKQKKAYKKLIKKAGFKGKIK